MGKMKAVTETDIMLGTSNANETNNGALQVGEQPDNWLNMDIPREFAANLGSEFSADDRQRLADDAVIATIESIPAAYVNPFVRNAAQKAAQMALGLTQLPSQEEGEK